MDDRDPRSAYEEIYLALRSGSVVLIGWKLRI